MFNVSLRCLNQLVYVLTISAVLSEIGNISAMSHLLAIPPLLFVEDEIGFQMVFFGVYTCDKRHSSSNTSKIVILHVKRMTPRVLRQG